MNDATEKKEGTAPAKLAHKGPRANPKLPAKEKDTGLQKRKVVQDLPPPPPSNASDAKIQKYIELLKAELQDGDITMEDVKEAMEDVPEDVRDAMEEQDWWEIDDRMEGSGIGRKKRKRTASGFKKKRARISTETEKQLERMLGFRLKPYW